MHPALAKTFDFLAKTANEAAAPALMAGLDEPRTDSQLGTLRALLDRRDVAGQVAILQRSAENRPGWEDVLNEKRGRLDQALRDGVLGKDPKQCANACQAIVKYREYDLVPQLIAVTEAVDNESSETAASAVLELAKHLYDDLNGPRNYSDRRDPQFVRRSVMGHLEKTAKNYPQHHCRQILEAFLVLAGKDGAVLLTVLSDPRNACYLPMLDILANSDHVGVTRLLLDFLDANQPPAAILKTISQRTDRPFVRRLLARWQDHGSAALRRNIKRIKSFAWADVDPSLFEMFERDEQESALKLLLSTGIAEAQSFAFIKLFLDHGAKEVRVAAMQALGELETAEANSLVLMLLRDKEPGIVVAAIGQARRRNLPGVLPQLIAMVENPNKRIRNAVRNHLPEFHFDAYWASFDSLDVDARRGTGELVRRIDVQAVERLRDELGSSKRNRKMKAAAMAASMRLSTEVEKQLIDLMSDDDELVREEIAKALGECSSEAAVTALRNALEDRFPGVREAARACLTKIEAITPKQVLTSENRN